MSWMPAWRAEKAPFAKAARLGDGARLYGGRWNSPGRPAIYCAGSLSLALLEILAHVQTEEDAGVRRVYFQLEIDERAVETVPSSELPKTWRSALNVDPCRKAGDAWLSRGSPVVLQVPSAIVPTENNLIINPLHPRFGKAVRWSNAKPFRLDARLLENIADGR